MHYNCTIVAPSNRTLNICLVLSEHFQLYASTHAVRRIDPQSPVLSVGYQTGAVNITSSIFCTTRLIRTTDNFSKATILCSVMLKNFKCMNSSV